MKNKFRIGITDDMSIMRCRLIVKLVEICGGIPVLIPTNLNKDVKKFQILEYKLSLSKNYQF